MTNLKKTRSAILLSMMSIQSNALSEESTTDASAMSDNIHPDFPVKEMTWLDEMVNRPRWCIPVLPKGELEVLLKAAIRLCEAGLDTTSEHCQKFFKEGLRTSFKKLMTEECNKNWNGLIRECVFNCTKQLVELCVAKLSQDCIPSEDCLPLLDLIAHTLNPDCPFHTVNRQQRPTISKSDDAIFAKPVIESDPRGWLVDLVNVFGELNGFERLLEIFTKQDLPSIQVIASLIKPFGLCSNVFTNQTITKYLMPLIQVVMGILDELSDDKLKDLWKSDDISMILIAIEEIVYAYPENHTLAVGDLERIQQKMRKKMNLPTRERKLESEVFDDMSENNISSDKVVIEFTKKQIKTVEDTFTCVICIGTLDKPMFATCCRTLIACKPCLDQWYRMGTKCPKCRAHKAKDMAFEVVGIGDTINALPFLKDES